jgi:hypothetical protein
VSPQIGSTTDVRSGSAATDAGRNTDKEVDRATERGAVLHDILVPPSVVVLTL